MTYGHGLGAAPPALSPRPTASLLIELDDGARAAPRGASAARFLLSAGIYLARGARTHLRRTGSRPWCTMRRSVAMLEKSRTAQKIAVVREG